MLKNKLMNKNQKRVKKYKMIIKVKRIQIIIKIVKIVLNNKIKNKVMKMKK